MEVSGCGQLADGRKVGRRDISKSFKIVWSDYTRDAMLKPTHTNYDKDDNTR